MFKKNTICNYPEKVIFSLTSKCNLNCWHCFRSLKDSESHEAAKELIDYVNRKILPHSRYLRIGGNGTGEPLLSGNFKYFLKTLNRDDLKEVSLISNFTLLDEESAGLIIEKVDHVGISIEGTGENYSRIRGFSWEKLINNIKLLSHLRKEKKSRKPVIELMVCAMLSNLDNLMGVFDLKKIGIDSACFREFYPYEESKARECLREDPVKTMSYSIKFMKRSKEMNMPVFIAFYDKYLRLAGGHSWANNSVSEFKKHCAEYLEKIRFKRSFFSSSRNLGKCCFPWECISVLSDGRISCCCSDLGLGRIDTYKEDVQDIFNNRNFISLRESMNRGEYRPVCHGCEFNKKEQNIQRRGRMKFNRL